MHDSDAVVHRLYEGEAVGPVEAAFPGVTVDGRIDRAKLAEKLIGKPEAIKRLEAIVHPLVRAVSDRFIERAGARAARASSCSTFRCCSRPAARTTVDAVVVVSAPADVQRARVLSRARHDGGKARCPAGAADVGRREARARAFRGGQLALASIPPVHRFMASCAPSRHFRAANRIRRTRMREIVFDTETTGLDPYQGDRLVEIGCVELVNGFPTGTGFHAISIPQRDMPDGRLQGARPVDRVPQGQAAVRRRLRGVPRLRRRCAAGRAQCDVRSRLHQCRARALQESGCCSATGWSTR